MTYRSIAVHSEVAAVRLWWTRARPWWDTERRAGDAQGTAALVMCRAHSALISHTGNAYTSRETLAGILYEKTVLRNETLLPTARLGGSRMQIQGAQWYHSSLLKSPAMPEPGGVTAARGQVRTATCTRAAHCLLCAGGCGKQDVPLMKLQHIKNYYSFVFSGFRQCNVIYSKKC